MVASLPLFLAPLAQESATHLTLRNRRTGAVVATAVEPALDPSTRRRGLLGRDHLTPGAAMILAPCRSIHTFFMRFAIDVVFVDRDGLVLKIYPSMPAWRLGASLRAFAAIELPPGTTQRSGTTKGDTLELVS